jgi:hypothetical protein
MHIFTKLAPILPFLALNLAAQPLQVLEGKQFHLRSGNVPEWREYAGKTPDGTRLDIRFAAQANAGQNTLFIRQDNVKLDWRVELNGRRLGSLFLMEAPLVHALPVPPGTLQTGENTLSIVPPRDNDDIVVGDIQLDSRPLREAVGQATLTVEVTDVPSGTGLPCRITIVDNKGALAPLNAFPDQALAVRPGVVYSPDGRARLGVRPGDYTLFATRGFEYGLATQKASMVAGQTQTVRMQIRREVPTPGLVSSDTHVHTFTYSRHGDATIDERVLTLAGEGIELPIATDHEYLTDSSEPARKMGVASYFTPVMGCEVTTAKGHFNTFPIVPGSRVPDNRILDWPRLMESIRSTPGVRVVVLNHPRNIHNDFQPFAATNFNAVTGENRRGFEFNFDAIEVANSSALQSDWKRSYFDWFALLNYGYRLTAVGSSDGHDVSRYIIGQGRSYVAVDDANLGKVDVEQACRSFREGRVLVSLGLLTQMTLDEKFGVGDLAIGLGEQMRVTVSVLAPSWITADQVELYANGIKIREQRIDPPSASSQAPAASFDPVKAKVVWMIPRPKHDVHLIALASGPGVTEPYWAIARPYQSSSPVWEPRVVGCTNPIWVDADGDGKFTAARSYAQLLIQRHSSDPAQLLPALRLHDEAVAAQAASLCQAAGRQVRGPEFVNLLARSPEPIQQGFKKFIGKLDQP